jgi:hypothetical protein
MMHRRTVGACLTENQKFALECRSLATRILRRQIYVIETRVVLGWVVLGTELLA